MILHLVDDEKIINRVISIFDETLPHKNFYICFFKSTIPVFVENKNNVLFYDGKNDISSIDFNKFKKVIIHSLTLEKILFYEKYINNNAICYWVLWGADLYNTLLEYKGYNLYYRKKHLPNIIKLKLFASKFGYVGQTEKKIQSFIRQHVSYFLSDCILEYELLKDYLKEYASEVKHLPFFYYPIDIVLGKSLMNSWAEGDVVLLGNSASITNNHEYVFKYLSQLSLSDRKVVAPISYGGNLEYKNYIKEVGYRLLKENFSPLEEYIALPDYNKLMTAAETCVYGSWRQEAAGNIFIALYLGAKVYLSNKSPLYLWFNSLNIKIFELESITDEEFRTPLAQKDKEKNRAILQARYNKDTLTGIILAYWEDNE